MVVAKRHQKICLKIPLLLFRRTSLVASENINGIPVRHYVSLHQDSNVTL